VPVAVCQPGNEADCVETYSEASALNGSLGALKGGELMDLLLK
jgi:2,3-bisphosphoglycerate-independent phosphoglycerate mutase